MVTRVSLQFWYFSWQFPPTQEKKKSSTIMLTTTPSQAQLSYLVARLLSKAEPT